MLCLINFESLRTNLREIFLKIPLIYSYQIHGYSCNRYFEVSCVTLMTRGQVTFGGLFLLFDRVRNVSYL